MIPRTLSENAGLQPEKILADMYAMSNEKNLAHFGVDSNDGKVKDCVEASIFDSLDCKSWAIKLTIDVVLTILKVDQIIMAKPAGGPNMENQAARAPDGYHG